LSSGGVI